MGKFKESDIQLAIKVQQKYGVPASIVLGQYALESGYGQKTVGENNYFNIKRAGTKTGYANYGSKEESFMAFGELLSKERYTSQTKNATTIEEYIQGVKDGGYAEDSQYVSKVMNIITKNNLTQYDNGNYGTGGTSETFGSSEGDIYGLKWWGDVVRVVFACLLLVGGVALLGLAVTGSPRKLVDKVEKSVDNLKKGSD